MLTQHRWMYLHGLLLPGTQKLAKRAIHRALPALCNSGLSAEMSSKNLVWIRQHSKQGLSQETLEKPFIRDPHDVLVRVKAASVNPLDVAMAGWYGDNMLRLLYHVQQVSKLGPIASTARSFKGETSPSVKVLGRDFSGTVEAIGNMVDKFKPGDEVYGAMYPTKEGSHAHYTLASQTDIAMKPASLNHVQAASIPYAALTFLSGLNYMNICSGQLRNKRVFLNAGAGGIGTFAIQYLKATGCEVTVSVSQAGRDIVSRLGADHILDYQSPSFHDDLSQLAGFDIAFDLVGDESALSSVKPQGRFITVVHPLMKSTDDKGVVCGGIYSATILAQKVAQALYNHGVHYSWAFFAPNSSALDDIRGMVERKQIEPVIDEVFPFSETPAAYEKVSKKKGRGKVIIEVQETPKS